MKTPTLIFEAPMKRLFLVAALALASGLSAGPAPVGVVTTLSGKVSLFAAGGSDKAGPLLLGQKLMAGDRVKTGANGRLSLVLVDGTQLKVNYNTDITLRDKDSKGKLAERGVGSIKIALGQLWAKVTKKNSRLEFETPAAVAAVKGTEPIFDVSELNSCIKLREGSLELQANGGSLSMGELTMLCMQNKGVKLSPDLLEKWDGKGTFENKFASSTASSTKVEVLFGSTDDSTAGKVVLEYQPKDAAGK